jgi:hypothetical protein
VLHCAVTREIVEILVDAGADLDARDTDHNSTALQYLIGDEGIARLLIDRGASVDVFAAARLGDSRLVEKCLRDDPACAEARANRPPFVGPGLHIYGWTSGFDLTPAGVARKFGHPQVVELILSRLPPPARLIDALWRGDAERIRVEIARHPTAVEDLHPGDKALLAEAAWWYRPESARLMLEVGFDPHVTGTHRSTPLDRASFHGYADIVELLLVRDPSPPLTFKNEFGVTPLGTCIYGSLNGWDTGHPRDHGRTIKLLLEAGSPLDPTILPTGNDELDAVMRAWLKKRTAMTTEDVEIVIEIGCTNLPGEEWDGQSTLRLGIQRNDEVIEAASAGLTRVVFRPVLRARRNTDGSANFRKLPFE